jgi:hypothetical protein
VRGEVSKVRNAHDAVNILVAVAGVAAGGNPVIAGAGAAMSGIKSVIDLLPFWRRADTPLKARIEALLTRALSQHHLTDDQRLLIPQMLERARVAHDLVISCARSPERIARVMADACKGADPAHAEAATQDAFVRVVTSILQDVLLDPQFCEDIRPLQDQAVAQSLAAIGETVEGIAGRQEAQHAEVMAAVSPLARIEQLLLEVLSGRTEDHADPGRYLPGLKAQVNTLPGLAADADDIAKALAAGEADRALTLARAMTGRLLARRQDNRDEAQRKDSEESDAIARSLATEADLLWKGKDRKGSLEQLVRARDEAASPDLRAEIADRLQRQFNLSVHIRGDLGAARDLVAEMMARGLVPDEITYSTLIAKAPGFDRAVELRDEMVARGLMPNEITYNTLIAKAPGFGRAVELRDEMVARGLVPNEITYSSLMEKAEKLEDAEPMLEAFILAGGKPNSYHFNALLSLAGGHMTAERIYRRMLGFGIRPNKFVVTSLIKQAPKVTDARRIAVEFKRAGGDIDAHMMGAIMVKTRDPAILRNFFDAMMRVGPRPNQVVMQHLILSAPDKPTKLLYLRAMRDLRLEPEPRVWAHLARHDIFADDE